MGYPGSVSWWQSPSRIIYGLAMLCFTTQEVFNRHRDVYEPQESVEGSPGYSDIVAGAMAGVAWSNFQREDAV